MSNDHYVPQFYFRSFSPDPVGREYIRLIIVNRRKFVPIAGIRGQCKKAGFYDYQGGLEAALGGLEGLAATAIKGVIDADVPPGRGSPEHVALADFTIIQRSRTLSAAEDADKMHDRMFKIANEERAKLEGIELSKYRFGSSDPVAIPLRIAAQCAPIAMQLGLHVFVNDTSEELVASDNPVIAHNQFCEGITYRGVLGWNCSGIQVFLPISPRHLLLFYDTQVYAVNTKRNRGTTRIKEVSEIRNLNAFQILTARENIYFRNDAMADSLLSQIERLGSRRGRKRQITVQSTSVATGVGTNSELIHRFERMLPAELRLGSVRIKRNMKRIPLNERGSKMRGAESSTDSQPTTEAQSTTRYAVRRSFSD